MRKKGDIGAARKRTVSRGLTISYQPGILVPKFCKAENQCRIAFSFTDRVNHTTVIGIVGAFGKTKATSSNFPLLLKFSATDILKPISLLCCSDQCNTNPHTILPRCHQLASNQQAERELF